jgi:hypothetical protein
MKTRIIVFGKIEGIGAKDVVAHSKILSGISLQGQREI